MQIKPKLRNGDRNPAFFTIPVRKGLDYINQWERCSSNNVLKEALLSWVRTGHFDALNSPSMPFRKASPPWKAEF
jgi:hypothetical protein